MLDVTPLVTAVDQLADHVRALPQSALRRGAAHETLELARELALRAQRLEGRSDPLSLPEVGEFVVADQLAVAGHDLAEALRTYGTEAELAAAERTLAEHAAGVRRR